MSEWGLKYNILSMFPFLPIYLPSSSSSPRFFSLLSFFAEGRSGVFFPPFPLPADLARSPPFLSAPFAGLPTALLGPSDAA